MSKKFLVALDLNKNELRNAVLQNLTVAPENAVNGLAYYDAAENKFCFYENGQWTKYATLSDLQTGLAGKIDTATYEAKIAELEQAIAAKVEQSAYDTKMGELDQAIAGKVAQGEYDAHVQEFDLVKADVETLKTTKVDTEQYNTDLQVLNAKDEELSQAVANTYTKEEVDTKIAEKDSLPDQTGHAGEFLTTNGTEDSWSALPVASAETAGIVKVGQNLTIEDGVLNAVVPEDLVKSVNGETGEVVVKAIQNANADATMIKVWVGSKEEYDALTEKAEDTLYYVQKDGEAVDVYELLDGKQDKLTAGTNIELVAQEDGTVLINNTYALKAASAETLGAVKVGANLTIDESGVLNAAGAVVSVNGQTGVVVLDKASVGLDKVDNTADLDKPISTATQAALDGKADKATTLAGYGIADAYTKEEVDAKVASVYKFKGSVETVAELPTEGNVEGDVYNVKATGENYAWVAATDDEAGHWDDLGGDIDLTPYITAEQIAETYLNKTDAANTYLAKTDAETIYATKEEVGVVSGEAVAKASFVNDALTPANGVATWTITHEYGEDVVVALKEVATGDEVVADITQGAGTVTVKMNASAEILAGTYKAVIMGI